MLKAQSEALRSQLVAVLTTDPTAGEVHKLVGWTSASILQHSLRSDG